MIAIASFAGTLAFLALAVLAWGDLGGFLAHPPRAAATACVIAFTAIGARSGISMGPGRREDARGRRAFIPAVLGSLLLAWLPPYMDRRMIWTIDGDVARWIGVGLFALGCTLRVWPMFALGRRFSPFVAIQPGHELVTDGIYRRLRHPSYLGALVAWAGWALVFRSSVGLLLVVPAIRVVIARIETEEALLASEFPHYVDYQRRSWRLVPGVY